MRRVNRLRVCVVALIAAAATWVPTAAFAQSVTITPVGTPAWSVVDTHVFTAEIGTAASGYQEFFDLGPKILPEPNHKNYPNVGVGPGAPHDPPYDQEIAQGLAALGISDKSNLSIADFSNGNGVNVAMMIVGNGGATGSSPEFADGPILPNALFPLKFELANKKDGADFSAPGELEVPTHTTLDPAFADLDGTSHLPFFIFDNADFANDKAASLVGSYQFELTIRDTAGNGYDMVIPYSVSGGPTAIPLPAAFVPGMAMLAMTLGVKPAKRLLCRKA